MNTTQKDRECRVLAMTYRPGHACPTVTLPLIPDILSPMSEFVPIPSGLPSSSDVAGDPGLRCKLTRLRHGSVRR
jgi:hypothetical protein